MKRAKIKKEDKEVDWDEEVVTPSELDISSTEEVEGNLTEVGEEDDQTWGNWFGNSVEAASTDKGKGSFVKPQPKVVPQPKQPFVSPQPQVLPPPKQPFVRQQPKVVRQPKVVPQPKVMPALPAWKRAKLVAASPGTLSPDIRNIAVDVYSCGFEQKGVKKGRGQHFDRILPQLKECLSVTDRQVQKQIDMWLDCRQFFSREAI